MATTGFWPVKGRLKDVINYAENPDKTTDRRFLDDDLAATLNYVENSDKTDQTMYVSGINCPKKRAYEQMMTTNDVSASSAAMLRITVIKAFRLEKSHPKKRTVSALKPPSECGAMTMR